ncbi:MAG TPA: hypothetical protein VIX41_03530 [Acidimicrobiales bacterium]
MASNDITFKPEHPIVSLDRLSQPLTDRLCRIIAALDLRIALTESDALMVRRITEAYDGQEER